MISSARVSASSRSISLVLASPSAAECPEFGPLCNCFASSMHVGSTFCLPVSVDLNLFSWTKIFRKFYLNWQIALKWWRWQLPANKQLHVREPWWKMMEIILLTSYKLPRGQHNDSSLLIPHPGHDRQRVNQYTLHSLPTWYLVLLMEENPCRSLQVLTS